MDTNLRSVALRLGIATVLIVVLIFGPDWYGRLTSGSRLDPRLRSASGMVDVQVTLGFPPQQFNQQELAKYGVFAGRIGDAISLRQVPASFLHSLASLYWVTRIEPLSKR